MGLLKLAIDRQSKSLVSFNGSATALPPFYELNTQPFRIQIVDPTGDPTDPYDVVDCSANGLRAIICQKVTGVSGDEAGHLLAATYEAGWAWDAGLEAFTGSINLNTVEIQQHIGELSHKAAILELNLMTGAVPETVFGSRTGDNNITINANGDDGGATAPSIITVDETVGTVAIQHGVGGITMADNIVTLAGLGLAGVPVNVFIWINAPAGSGFIGGNFIVGSASTAGFQVVLSAIPENNNYQLTYVLTF